MTHERHPYRDLPPAQYWRSGVADLGPGEFDPVQSVKFQITRAEPVATLGSCFAQHLARHIQQSGFNSLVAETLSDGESPTGPAGVTAGHFSARYGNVYTARQALQLLARAFDGWTPAEDIWERDGRYFDAFRPGVHPHGFESVAALVNARRLHLDAVREVFTRARTVVFTLGLTEAWASTVDGAVYPVAPGVVAGRLDHDRHRFVNFTYPDVYQDLLAWCHRLRDLNADVRVILTVSPVPLRATYEPGHVWVSTTYSKAVLRAAAGDVARALAFVDYFPSYEIATCPQVQGRYFADDLRDVTATGVSHVMRVFSKHYLRDDDPRRGTAVSAAVRARQQHEVSEVFCDEDLLDP